MKKMILLFVLFYASISFAQQIHKKYRVLFIGNSYTYVNNLPDLIKNVALANGDTVIYDSNCIGGYSFYNHSVDAATLLKLQAGNWDYVVLQAQSQEPSFSPSQVNAQTLPYALKLDTLIHFYNPCATTVFYETWGRKNGDASNCAAYPPICTYLGMQNRLKQSYKLFADSSKAIVAPAGEAFRECIINSAIDLYQADESHPSMEGSYLTAAVFYETLFQKSVLSNTFNPGINSVNLALLQTYANKVVNDSALKWNLGINCPRATISYSLNAVSAIQFNTSSPNLNNRWYFGDGQSSTLNNPSHQFAIAGLYTVSHVVGLQCKKDSVVAVLSYTPPPSGLQAFQTASKVKLFPNPCNDVLFLEAPHVQEQNGIVEIWDVNATCVLATTYTSFISTTTLIPGVYILTMSEHGTLLFRKRFVKTALQ